MFTVIHPNPQIGVIGRILLDPDWRARQPDLLEFVVLGSTSTLADMLIEKVGGIAYRVQIPDRKEDDTGYFMRLTPKQWTEASPQKKLLMLA